MIGKAIHRILKDKISDLNNGGIYPVIMPQNAKHSISASTNYPAIVYHNYTEYETSKDKNPNIVFCRVMLQIISDSYNSLNTISTQVRDVLDHYIDKTDKGLAFVSGYSDGGYTHSFIENIDIQHIFYIDEEDEYFSKLKLFTRRIEYEVYYYDDIMKLSYNVKNSDGYTPTNPLALCYDFTQSKLMRGTTALGDINYDGTIVDNSIVDWVFNKLGRVKSLSDNTITTTNYNFYEYMKSGAAGGSPLLRPVFQDGISENTMPFLNFTGFQTIAVESIDSPLTQQFVMPYGGMVVLVYKPTGTDGENYILGSDNQTANLRPLIFSHKKVGSDITLHFKTNGITFDASSNERTLISSTDSSSYWDADYHFFCLSLGGSKQYTGGSYNQQGWYEYFNSNYNPKLTTGQILKNNSITGNTDDLDNDMDNNFYINRIGQRQIDDSAGFRMYEMLLFIPNEKQTHNINADAAPFQPTDIIYKKLKDYIYNKYEKLN
tara:strand:+ start:213 stop:1682 length:1470 start_codon:yes stop_codon:yes gene_type:complete